MDGFVGGVGKVVYLPGIILKKMGVFRHSIGEECDKGRVHVFPTPNRTSMSYQIGAGVGDVVGLVTHVTTYGIVSLIGLSADIIKNRMPNDDTLVKKLN